MLESIPTSPALLHRVFIDDNGLAPVGAFPAVPPGGFVNGTVGDFDAVPTVANPNGNIRGNPVVTDPAGDAIGGQDTSVGTILAGSKVATFSSIISPAGVSTLFLAMTSSSPQADSLGTATLTLNAGTIINSSGAPIDINVFFGDTDYAAPLRGIARSSMSLTVGVGTVTATYQTYDDPANRQFGGTTENPSAGAVLIDSASITGTLANGSQSVNSGPVAYNFTGPYAKSAHYTLHMSAGAQITSFGIQISNAPLTVGVPEPGTMAMAFSALPLLGLGYFARRRRAA